MELFTLTRTVNGSVGAGSKYLYKILDAAGNVVAQDSDNNKFIAMVLYTYETKQGRRWTIQSRAMRPNALGGKLTAEGKRQVEGIALIERSPEGRPVTYQGGEPTADGDLLFDWETLHPAFYSTYAADRNRRRAADLATPDPAASADEDEDEDGDETGFWDREPDDEFPPPDTDSLEDRGFSLGSYES